MKILLATGNSGKALEIRDILSLDEESLLILKDFPDITMPPETGDTFAANAIEKAEYCARKTGIICLADDSGLEVEALGNEPGVYSARYSGPDADDEKNNAKLLTELEKNGDRDRKARFVCVAALAIPGKETVTIEGEIKGRIIDSPQGSEGFGYDPLFMPEGEDRTFAEMGVEKKSTMSHRARAFVKLKDSMVENGLL